MQGINLNLRANLYSAEAVIDFGVIRDFGNDASVNAIFHIYSSSSPR